MQVRALYTRVKFRSMTCAPQKPLQVAICMTPGADSSRCLPLAKELCSTFSLCAKLISHVATSMRLAALLPPQPYGAVGASHELAYALWEALVGCRVTSSANTD
jgi:hypothetical protein